MSEFRFIERLRKTRPHSDSRIKIGIGDDAAVIRPRPGFDLMITTDLLVEGVDFSLEQFTPQSIGHKALAVSLSDIAAMGAEPKWALISLGIPEPEWKKSLQRRIFSGIDKLAERYGVAIIGGDISRTLSYVTIDSTVIGEVRSGRSVSRAGASTSDYIFVTGALGGAAGGLRLLRDPEVSCAERSTSPESRNRRALLARQMKPFPRLEWGRFLGNAGIASAMIDLSDGLSSDLAHICRESGVGAAIEAKRLPIDGSLSILNLSLADRLSLALNGGEDFELLFTVPAGKVRKIPSEIGGVPATQIGRITDSSSRINLKFQNGRSRRLSPHGFEHFRDSR